MAEAKAGGGSALRWLALAVALVAVLLLGRAASSQLVAFAQWVETLGAWGPVVFIVGYVLGALAFVPGSLLTIGAGAIFGLATGAVYVFVAATIAACSAFLLSRTVARQAIEKRIAGNARFAAIDRAIASDGRRIAFLLRLSPVFPFSLLNYALGLTRIRFADYAVACIGMLPGTLLYVYIGSLAGDLAAVAAGAETTEGSGLRRAFFVAGLVVTAIVTVLITRIARRALAEATAEAGPI